MGLRAQPTAMITGAGGGFGRALALAVAKRRGRLLISDINEAGLAETARRAESMGATEVRTFRCDVTNLGDIEAISAAFPDPIDLVVNNAGVSSGGLVGELSMQDWRWTIEVDLFGVIHGCHVFVPRLKQQGFGHVLNVASSAGLICLPRMGAYNAAKAGVIAISETLAGELEGTGVGVTVLCPSFFQTDIVNSGHFADEETKRLAHNFMKTARPVDEVVKATLEAVERDELYTIPMADARWMWRIKRLLPAPFRKLVAKTLPKMQKM